MNSRDDWQDPDKVIDHLAHELIAGRLGLCLGAGLSSFYGLPNWPKLVERLCTACAETRDVEDDVLQVGALRAKHYANRKDEFLTLVSGQLYESVTLDFNKIQKTTC